jgi:hypothetical protein
MSQIDEDTQPIKKIFLPDLLCSIGQLLSSERTHQFVVVALPLVSMFALVVSMLIQLNNQELQRTNKQLLAENSALKIKIAAAQKSITPPSPVNKKITIPDVPVRPTDRMASGPKVPGKKIAIILRYGQVRKTTRTLWKIAAEFVNASTKESPALFTVFVAPTSNQQEIEKLQKLHHEIGFIINTTNWQKLPAWAPPKAPVCLYPGTSTQGWGEHPIIKCFDPPFGHLDKTRDGDMIALNINELRHSPGALHELGKTLLSATTQADLKTIPATTWLTMEKPLRRERFEGTKQISLVTTPLPL